MLVISLAKAKIALHRDKFIGAEDGLLTSTIASLSHEDGIRAVTFSRVRDNIPADEELSDQVSAIINMPVVICYDVPYVPVLQNVRLYTTVQCSSQSADVELQMHVR